MSNNIIDQNRIRQFFFIIVIVLLGVLLFLELLGFLPALLGAITLYILMHNWMFHIIDKWKWKKGLAALFLMFVSMIIILLPIGLLVNMLSSKVSFAIEHSSELANAIKTVVHSIEDRFDVQLLSDQTIQKIQTGITDTVPQIVNATFNTLTTIFFMYFLLYFMLVNGRSMERTLYEYLPLKDENAVLVRKEINNMVVSNAIGIPVIALLQGIVGLIGYFIIGVDQPWFWFVVTCITAMLPVVGAALAYVPLAIIFFADNETGKGIFMLIYGFGVIGTVDNIFRFTLQKRIGNIHPLITVFGVIIGLKLFGFIGLIFGPLLISMFILLLKIYSNEFITKQREITNTLEN
ncbi:MAG: AI-2E family transporter [Terrimonas sp.]|nr:AI-2E family transporter [Terrimonas sp.]